MWIFDMRLVTASSVPRLPTWEQRKSALKYAKNSVEDHVEDCHQCDKH